ncbi:Cytochrome P450 71A20 [Acorus gramineus]|uniref:Cytochrome P450 71A20 n=1 Tax=Acorus gramineus TaxID=55184 RepID=A0AAV9B662_ACOGR|nr:Cytochrome P450 71A20 [Acorus gramineus]
MVELQNFSSSGGLVNLSEALVSLTNNVVCRVAFGRKFDGGAKNHFHAMLTEFLVLLGTFDVGDFIPSLAWVSGLNGFNAMVNKCYEEFELLSCLSVTPSKF